MPQVLDNLGSRLGHEIVDGLPGTVCVSDGETRASPCSSLQGVGFPAAVSGGTLVDIDSRCWLDLERFNRAWISEKQTSLDVLGQNVSGNADGNGTLVIAEGPIDVPNRIGKQELQSVGLRVSRTKHQACGRVPRPGVFPFVVRIGPTMDHPLIKAFESDAARRRIGEEGRGSPGALLVKNR